VNVEKDESMKTIWEAVNEVDISWPIPI